MLAFAFTSVVHWLFMNLVQICEEEDGGNCTGHGGDGCAVAEK